MAAIAGKQLWTLAAAPHFQKLNIRSTQLCSLLQIRNYAARKGTRERAKKKKVKVEVKKVGFIPHNMRVKKTDIIPLAVLRMDDTQKSLHQDDVWIGKYHKWKVYSFAEAVECHRETHHPTCYNLPNAFLTAHVELDMRGEKPTKVIEGFSRTVNVPHIFNHGEIRTVIAFAKSPELLELADQAGATISGNAELIARIQSGDLCVNEYSAVVAHPEIMADLSVIRGLLKRKFPNPRTGTLGLDLPAIIRKILHGIKYKAVPHERQILYATINAPIGRLPMDPKHLEENFIALIRDIEAIRPKREGQFITRTRLESAPSTESFKIDFEKYLNNEVKEDSSYESDDDEEIVRSNIA